MFANEENRVTEVSENEGAKKNVNADEVLKQTARHFSALQNALKKDDLKTCDKSIRGLNSAIQDLKEAHEQIILQYQHEVQKRLDYYSSKDYPQNLSDGFQRLNLPIKGEFPTYSLPPFTIDFDLQNACVKLKLGRKIEKLNCLNTAEVLRWIDTKYKKLVQRPLNVKLFMKELLGAYELKSQVIRNSQIMSDFGIPVALDSLWQIFAFRNEHRIDYPKDYFAYDLSKLRHELPSLCYTVEDSRKEITYQLEFDLPKKKGNAMILRNFATGQEEYYSTLTIYKQEAAK